MKKWILVCWVSLALISEAQSNSEVFAGMFFGEYRAGRCYENSERLAQVILKEQGFESDLVLVKLQNKGIGTFGLVNAEKARSFVQGKLIAEEKNWYEHWFVMDEKGTVYDFDFSFSPSPLPLKDYLEEMFLNEAECTTPSWTELCGGREDKLNEYWVTVFDARQRLENPDGEVWTGSLGDFIESTPRVHHASRWGVISK